MNLNVLISDYEFPCFLRSRISVSSKLFFIFVSSKFSSEVHDEETSGEGQAGVEESINTDGENNDDGAAEEINDDQADETFTRTLIQSNDRNVSQRPMAKQLLSCVARFGC